MNVESFIICFTISPATNLNVKGNWPDSSTHGFLSNVLIYPQHDSKEDNLPSM